MSDENELPFDPTRLAALTFDCYGTLIDWETGIVGVLRPLFTRYGLLLSEDALLELYARHEAALESEEYLPYREVLRQTVLGMAAEEGVVLAPGEAEALADSLPHWPVFPDTIPALDYLRTRYRLAILSNVDDDLFALSAKHQLGGMARFDVVVTAEQVRSYKPAPPHFTEALERLGQPAESVLHVAQSRYHDIAPARALGLKTVWVNRRAGKAGGGATAIAHATPDLEVPDLATLVHRISMLKAISASPPANGKHLP